MIFARKQIRVRVAGILIENEKMLLVAHKKQGEVYWLLPGGGVNYGESLEEALKREFNEELHIDVEIGKVALVFDSIDPHGSRHIVNICFYCFQKSGEFELGKEKRLYDYDFLGKDEISNIAMYPPINMDLVSILNQEKIDIYKKEIYKGKLWTEK